MAWRENVTFGNVKMRESAPRVLRAGGDPIGGTKGNAIPTDAEFSLTEDSGNNTINVQVQMKDAAGNDVGGVQEATAIISGSQDGTGLVSTAPDGDKGGGESDGVIAGTNGELLTEHVSAKYLALQTDADGKIDVDVVDSAGSTFYMAVRLPTGHIVVSGALDFSFS